MAYEIPGFSFTLPAGADLSSSLFCGVTINSSGKAILPAAQGDAILGVINNKPQADEAATIVHSGIVQMKAGAVITLSAGGTAVMCDTAGRAVPYTGTTGDVQVGVALEAASAAGIIIAVLLIPSRTPAPA